MEKFAVDLDKVLDEFEFNEDQAEQLVAGTGKGCTDGGDTCRQALRSRHGTEPTVSSDGTSGFPKNGMNHWQSDLVVHNNNKLNVSGVFSSLNEYLNAGNTSISESLQDSDSQGSNCGLHSDKIFDPQINFSAVNDNALTDEAINCSSTVNRTWSGDSVIENDDSIKLCNDEDVCSQNAAGSIKEDVESIVVEVNNEPDPPKETSPSTCNDSTEFENDHENASQDLPELNKKLESACNPIGFDTVEDFTKEELEKYLEELCDETCDVQKCVPDINEEILEDSDLTNISPSLSENCSSSECKSVGRNEDLDSSPEEANTQCNSLASSSIVPDESPDASPDAESEVENLNASISMSMLSTSKATANVTNVISIECQQTKNCLVNGDLQEESDSRTIGSESEGGDINGSEEVIGETVTNVIQVPADGNRINILGEEERPCRPKFLLLPSKISVESQSDSTEHHNATLGSPGETPGTHLEPLQELENSACEVASPDPSDCSSLEVAISPVQSSPYALSPEERSLGKLPPFWVPDSDAANCMLCDLKFTVLKRRHHCRACGKVLCSKCCCLKSRLEYMENAEARVCHPCYDILTRVVVTEQGESASECPDTSNTPLGRQPNPNNPMEYCSTIPPLEQAASTTPQPVPSVLVPVGVLKREGCARPKGDVAKQVMFSDGIRPGGDLTELDGSSEPRPPYRRQERILKRVGTPPGIPPHTSHHSALRSLLSLEPKSKSYIPSKGLPPLAYLLKGELKLEEAVNLDKLFASLKSEEEPAVMFALNRNLFVQVKILNLDCCVNRLCWCFSTMGMSSVGQDEIVIILEYLPEDTTIPRDIFHHLNSIYQEASRGNMVSEMGHSVFQASTFLGSSDHGGFMYIRPSFQCLHKLILPAPPYLVAVLFHRWEIPWAKVFPIRLMLRLGAEFRYYPCMLVSIRQRKPVFCEIGHTIINLLADFRNLSYTLPSVRGLVIHMEDRHTSILLPKNCYDQVARALNNSNDHVLALAANFSMSADSHLVCIQSHEDESYHTQAINIHNKPRKVTGASFVVFNGALKMSSNLTAKSSIVEDGLMVQITPDTIQELRSALRKMQDFSVRCGPAGAVLPDEMVNIKWVQDDRNFNIGVVSFIDSLALDGVPSIRVHNGTDYMGTVRFIRWTEVFILQSGENSERSGDPLDISRLSESLARATCLALVNYLDLLAQAGLTKIAVRANIHPENVGYEAGSRGEKLPPIYMKSLDNELVPVLHKAASMAPESPPVLLELIFHVMLQ